MSTPIRRLGYKGLGVQTEETAGSDCGGRRSEPAYTHGCFRQPLLGVIMGAGRGLVGRSIRTRAGKTMREGESRERIMPSSLNAGAIRHSLFQMKKVMILSRV